MKDGWIKTQSRAFISAIAFLSRLPVGVQEYDARILEKSVVYFPLVGVVIALISAAVFLVAQIFWDMPVAIVLAMIAAIVATGGFHEDGLADTADGLGGGWTVEDKLRIMKDSRIGTYGGLALFTALLLKYSALITIPAEAVPQALICGHVLGRWSILPLLRYCDYLGGSEGSGRGFVGAVDGRTLMVGSLLSCILVVVCAPWDSGAILLCSVLVIVLSRQLYVIKLGGITGDTLGATNQLVEIGVYLMIAAHSV